MHLDCRTGGPIHAWLVCPQLQRLTLVGGPAGRKSISAMHIEFLQRSVLGIPGVTVTLEQIPQGGTFVDDEDWDGEDDLLDDEDFMGLSRDALVDLMSLSRITSVPTRNGGGCIREGEV